MLNAKNDIVYVYFDCVSFHYDGSKGGQLLLIKGVFWPHFNEFKLICLFKSIKTKTYNTKEITFHGNFHSGKFHCDRSKGQK